MRDIQGDALWFSILMKGESTMNRKEHSFIQFGDDRIRLDSIEGYGIRTIPRYFVRNEAHSEVDKRSYEGAFELYMCRRRVHCMSEASRWEADGRNLPPCFTRRANAVLTFMPSLPNWTDFSSTSRKPCPTKIAGIGIYRIESVYVWM